MAMAVLALALIGAVLVVTLTLALKSGRRAADVPVERRAEQPLLTRPCPHCHAQIATHETRCSECGTSFGARKLLCPKCGAHVGAVVKFCKRCHTQIDARRSA